VSADESATLLQRAEFEGQSADSVLATLADRVSAVVATRVDMGVQWGRTLHRPRAYAAMAYYQSAFEAVLAGDADAGIERFLAAWRTDSSFVFAGIMAAGNALAVDRFALGDSVLASLAAFEPAMLPLERHQYRRARALARSDVAATLAEARTVARIEPAAPFLLAQYAEDAAVANRPREALRALDALAARRGARALTPSEAMLRATALHTLGRHADELRVIDATMAGQPTEPHFASARIPALAALGRGDSLRVHLAALGARDPGTRPGAGVPQRRGGAAGARPRGGRGAPPRRRDRVAVRARPVGRRAARATALGRRAAARRRPERRGGRAARRRARRRRASVHPRAGVGAPQPARRARRAAARTADARALGDSLARLAARGHNGVETYRRARIAAELGDGAGAVALIEQALQEGFVTHRELHVDPAFRRLRGDARFRQGDGAARVRRAPARPASATARGARGYVRPGITPPATPARGATHPPSHHPTMSTTAHAAAHATPALRRPPTARSPRTPSRRRPTARGPRSRASGARSASCPTCSPPWPARRRRSPAISRSTACSRRGRSAPPSASSS
jgi:hypothetical protein